ncbi:MAG TPA: deoxyguanosinetriphosphate triphosphohydrolase [Chthoniobacteraceae bacterium]|jgi:dGTPase
MRWPELLCADRLGRAKPGRREWARSDFQRDSDRIIFCSAFRRLQDKTQVFPLADNDYVRTRLTHSLEVASVGRSLGTRIGAEICARHRLEQHEIHPSDFGAIVHAAALGHDLGNPPFGHSGEDAIRHWFTSGSGPALAAREGLSVAEIADIESYEGNAQGFRILTRLQMPDNAGGLQLTHATLGAFTKYPRASELDPSSHTGASTKKFGFFQSERDYFSEVAEHCGLLPRQAPGCWARHPLAFLVEAADDICYRLVDYEDGVRLGHLRYEEVRDAFLAIIPPSKHPRDLDSMSSRKSAIEMLRAMAIGVCLAQCTGHFLDVEPQLLDGTFDEPLTDCIPAAPVLREIQKHSRRTIYATERGVQIEAAGYEVLGGLLDVFMSAVNDLAARGDKAARRSEKLARLLPAECTQLTGETGPYLRLMRMLDFVSGMTDSYAVSLYKKVRGISLPGQ